MSSAEIKGFAVEALIVATLATMAWLPVMRRLTDRAVAAGTIDTGAGRATFARVSAVPLVLGLAIGFALLTADLALPAAVRVLGYVVAAAAIATSLASRRSPTSARAQSRDNRNHHDRGGHPTSS